MFAEKRNYNGEVTKASACFGKSKSLDVSPFHGETYVHMNFPAKGKSFSLSLNELQEVMEMFPSFREYDAKFHNKTVQTPIKTEWEAKLIATPDPAADVDTPSSSGNNYSYVSVTEVAGSSVATTPTSYAPVTVPVTPPTTDTQDVLYALPAGMTEEMFFAVPMTLPQ